MNDAKFLECYSMKIPRLSLSVHMLYQELIEQTLHDEITRNIGSLAGIFVTKKVKGRTYHYLQYRETGKQKQIYLGPNSAALQKALKHWKEERPSAKLAAAERRRLCAMLRQGRALALDTLTARVLGLLANSGVFRLGAILVGTHAFRAYSNLLGVQWKSGALRTHDLDLVCDPKISLLLPSGAKIDLQNVLERARIGFIPIPAFNPRHPSTSFRMAGHEIRLDILTPLTGRHKVKPVEIPALKSYAMPLRFLDYLIEDHTPCVLINGNGILVNVPQPARFAWHKLILSSRRSISELAKKNKDLSQAKQLFEILIEERQGDILMAWEILAQRGKAWYQPAKNALRRLNDPELTEQIFDIIKMYKSDRCALTK